MCCNKSETMFVCIHKHVFSARKSCVEEFCTHRKPTSLLLFFRFLRLRKPSSPHAYVSELLFHFSR